MTAVETPVLWAPRGARKAVFDLNVASRLVITVPAVILGWAVRNMSATTAAAIDLYDGRDATGDRVFPITLAANESNREWCAPMGVELDAGLWLNVTAGEVAGAIFWTMVGP